MYVDLKHIGFAADVPDKAKTTMLDKLPNQISDYAAKDQIL
jgi:hypothetical protein